MRTCSTTAVLVILLLCSGSAAAQTFEVFDAVSGQRLKDVQVHGIRRFYPSAFTLFSMAFDHFLVSTDKHGRAALTGRWESLTFTAEGYERVDVEKGWFGFAYKLRRGSPDQATWASRSEGRVLIPLVRTTGRPEKKQ